MRIQPGLSLAAARTALVACNEKSARYGLALTPDEVGMILARQAEILRETGRVEFGAGAPPMLAEAFCDSPCIQRDEYAETLCALTEIFYYFKNETELADETLLRLMRAAFDESEGSLDYVAGTALENLRRRLRNGPEEAAETEETDGEDA